MATDEQLETIRARIDDIDGQLLSLISDRARCAQEVAEIKLAAVQADTQTSPLFIVLNAKLRCFVLFRKGTLGRYPTTTWLGFFAKSCPAVWRLRTP